MLIGKINMVTKHKKPTQTDPGGITKMESPMSMSNVMLIDPEVRTSPRASSIGPPPTARGQARVPSSPARRSPNIRVRNYG